MLVNRYRCISINPLDVNIIKTDAGYLTAFSGDNYIAVPIKYNPELSESFEDSAIEHVYYAGRPFPVPYQSTNRARSITLKFLCFADVLEKPRRASELSWVGIFRPMNGRAVPVSYSYSVNHTYALTHYADVTVKMERIDEEGWK